MSPAPTHIAIIMDGNGRWAKDKGLPRIEGHRRGVEVVDDVVEEALDLGVKVLTLYAFSHENWSRPTEETAQLMQLLYEFLIQKKPKMLKKGIALRMIGNKERLPQVVQDVLDETIFETAGGKTLTLVLALSYGSRDEWIRATKNVFNDIVNKHLSPSDLTEIKFSEYLDTRDFPDPDLVIRTSGEVRLSNFLMWQAAYAELLFLPVLWPDFTRAHFRDAVGEYQKRERRFGGT